MPWSLPASLLHSLTLEELDHLDQLSNPKPLQHIDFRFQFRFGLSLEGRHHSPHPALLGCLHEGLGEDPLARDDTDRPLP